MDVGLHGRQEDVGSPAGPRLSLGRSLYEGGRQAEPGAQGDGADQEAEEDFYGLLGIAAPQIAALDVAEFLLRAEIVGQHRARPSRAALPEDLAEFGELHALRDNETMDPSGIFRHDELEQFRAAMDESVAQAAAFAERADGFKEMRCLALDKRGEERGLAGVAGVERLLGGAGAASDLAHTGALETPVEKDFGSNVEQSLGAGGDFLGGRAAAGRNPLTRGRFAD